VVILSAALKAKCRRAIADAISYIHGRQSPSGGFCFYRHGGVDEPNLGDTYYAVATLKLLQAQIPAAERIEQFLSQSRLFGLTYLYFYVFTLARLASDHRMTAKTVEHVNSLTIGLPDEQHRANTSDWLENARKTIRLQQHFAMTFPPSLPTLSIRKNSAATPTTPTSRPDCHTHVVSFLKSLNKGGGFGDRANLWDTYLAQSVLSLLAITPDPQTIEFVDSLQRPPFGFAMSGSSTMASLDVVFAGVRCCELLALPIRHAMQALEFTLGCQTADGGFAHASVALPNLEFTYRAVRTLVSLAPELVRVAECADGSLDVPQAAP
jgi:hypothetical protein